MLTSKYPSSKTSKKMLTVDRIFRAQITKKRIFSSQQILFFFRCMILYVLDENGRRDIFGAGAALGRERDTHRIKYHTEKKASRHTSSSSPK